MKGFMLLKLNFFFPIIYLSMLLPRAGDNTCRVFYASDDKGKLPGVWFSAGFPQAGSGDVITKSKLHVFIGQSYVRYHCIARPIPHTCIKHHVLLLTDKIAQGTTYRIIFCPCLVLVNSIGV